MFISTISYCLRDWLGGAILYVNAVPVLHHHSNFTHMFEQELQGVSSYYV